MSSDFLRKIEAERVAQRRIEALEQETRRQESVRREEERRRSAMDYESQRREELAVVQQASRLLEPLLRSVLQTLPGQTELLIKLDDWAIFTLKWGAKFGPTREDERRMEDYTRKYHKPNVVSGPSLPSVLVHDYYTVGVRVTAHSISINGEKQGCETRAFIGDPDILAEALARALDHAKHHESWFHAYATEHRRTEL